MVVMDQAATSKVLKTSLEGVESGLGFGCMGMTAFYGAPMKDDDVVALLKEVYDGGVRHFDTAEIYKTGNPIADGDSDIYNEQQISKFFKTIEDRSSYTVATKFMPPKWSNQNDYDTIKKALTNSLERLGLDYVDIYYSHRVLSLESIKEFVVNATKLKQEGLCKGIGISEISGKWLQEVISTAGPVDVIQQEWSLLTRNLEDSLVPVCKQHNIPIVAYSPLSRMLLAQLSSDAPPSDWRQSLPRFGQDTFDKNKKVLSDMLLPMSEKYNCTVAQLSLSWLFNKAKELGVTVIPIPGSTKIKNATSNAEAATKLGTIEKADMDALDTLYRKVEGNRGDKGYESITIEAQT